MDGVEMPALQVIVLVSCLHHHLSTDRHFNTGKLCRGKIVPDKETVSTQLPSSMHSVVKNCFAILQRRLKCSKVITCSATLGSRSIFYRLNLDYIASTIQVLSFDNQLLIQKYRVQGVGP